MRHITGVIQQKGLLILVYLANLFLSFHYFLTAYVNSSFLGSFVSQEKVSALYIVASLINIVIFFYASHVLRLFGNWRLTLVSAAIDLLAVLGIAFFKEPSISLFLFVIHQAIVPVILFNLDIFLEHSVKNESVTGEIRAAFLTITNAALVISPLLLAVLGIANNNFSQVYFLSGLFLVPLLLIVSISLRGFKDPAYVEFNLKRDLERFIGNKNIAAVFGANFLLQFFYSWMVIYVPIYLNQVIGFSWTEIGLMLGVALLPFVLFEFPIGALADHLWGEKEMMIIGFAIMSLFLFFIPLVGIASFTLFAALMFMTRVGAALVEITTESYFFKQTKEEDADLMSLFRISRPFSYVVGPAVGFLALSFTSMAGMFIILSGIMLLGIPFALRIKDSR